MATPTSSLCPLCPQETVDWFNALRAARFHYLQVAFPGASDADVSGCRLGDIGLGADHGLPETVAPQGTTATLLDSGAPELSCGGGAGFVGSSGGGWTGELSLFPALAGAEADPELPEGRLHGENGAQGASAAAPGNRATPGGQHQMWWGVAWGWKGEASVHLHVPTGLSWGGWSWPPKCFVRAGGPTDGNPLRAGPAPLYPVPGPLLGPTPARRWPHSPDPAWACRGRGRPRRGPCSPRVSCGQLGARAGLRPLPVPGSLTHSRQKASGGAGSPWTTGGSCTSRTPW